jgi:tetratricopeptide (TPR) repeat protein
LSRNSQEQTAIGDTPNRAARLQDLAEPGGIVIDATTRRLVGGLFEFRGLGAVLLRGLPEPVDAFELRGERPGESRFEALRAASLSPFIGREDELDLLLRRWRQARAGAGRVVLISGEPGIGKSRLLAKLDEQLAGQAFTRLRYFCSPHMADTPLHPVIRQLEVAAGFKREDQPADRARRLRALLQAAGPSDEEVGLVAALLHLPEHGLPPSNPSPQRRKERLFTALLDQIEHLSRQRPLLMLFEDLHWADPSTRELLDHSIRRIASLPVLLVLTFRPEFDAPWTGHAGVTAITLSRLDRSEAIRLATQLGSQFAPEGSLLDRIVSQSDGVPLFIGELTRAVLEAAPDTSAITVPPTLQASLLARLDRIPTARQVAQIGSMIGRDFSRSLLAVVAEMTDEAIDEGLDQLVAAGLLFRRGDDAEASYMFKHALVQDAAYESLLRVRRAALHEALGLVLERDAEAMSADPALLGHHFAHAGDPERASLYYLRAGEQSAAASAVVEAEAHLSRGLAQAKRIVSAALRILREAELTVALGSVQVIARGIASPEHERTFHRAVELCRSLDTRNIECARLAAIAFQGQASYEMFVGRLDSAFQTMKELVATLQSSPDRDLHAFAVSGYGSVCISLARLREGTDACATVVADIETSAEPGLVIHSGFDAYCLVLGQYALMLALQGYLAQSRARLQLAFDRAEKLRHIPTRAMLLAQACITMRIMDDRVSLRSFSEELVQIAEEHGYKYFEARGKCYVGLLKGLCGQHVEAIRILDHACRDLEDIGVRLQAPHRLAMKAEVHALMGQHERADANLVEGLSIGTATGESWTEAELYRRKGELGRADFTAAEFCFQRAVTVAREQGAKLFELRASVSLAHLWRDHGRVQDAQDLLAPIYGWFTEGFDAPDLIEASSLLEKLASAPNLHPE